VARRDGELNVCSRARPQRGGGQHEARSAMNKGASFIVSSGLLLLPWRETQRAAAGLSTKSKSSV